MIGGDELTFEYELKKQLEEETNPSEMENNVYLMTTGPCAVDLRSKQLFIEWFYNCSMNNSFCFEFVLITR